MLYKNIDISQAAFYNVSEDAAKEFIEHRQNIKKPLTQRAFDRMLKRAVECSRYGYTPDEAIEATVDNGWQGITPEYLAASKSRRMQAIQEASEGGTRDRGLIEDLQDRSWAEDMRH